MQITLVKGEGEDVCLLSPLKNYDINCLIILLIYINFKELIVWINLTYAAQYEKEETTKIPWIE